jgi:hypothetical protein
MVGASLTGYHNRSPATKTLGSSTKRPDRQHAARRLDWYRTRGRSKVSCLAWGSVVNSGCEKTGPGMSRAIASA